MTYLVINIPIEYYSSIKPYDNIYNVIRCDFNLFKQRYESIYHNNKKGLSKIIDMYIDHVIKYREQMSVYINPYLLYKSYTFLKKLLNWGQRVIIWMLRDIDEKLDEMLEKTGQVDKETWKGITDELKI